MKLPDIVTTQIDAYQCQYRHPDLPRFDVSGLYCLSSENAFEFSEADRWPASWPNGARPGVYMVFDGEMKLLYVGKAAPLAPRLTSHFRYESGRGSGCKPFGRWSAPPAFVATVAVHEIFEAPSFEEFLIDRLQPPDNHLWIRPREAAG